MNYYDFALKDLKSAEIMYKYSNEYDVIVVSCQQYVEKSLKHLLQLKNGELLKTHKLHTLLNKIDMVELNEFDRLFFLEIENFYFDKRYPGEDYIETTKEDCDRIYRKTLEYRNLIEKLIKFYEKIDNGGSVRKMSLFDEVE